MVETDKIIEDSEECSMAAEPVGSVAVQNADQAIYSIDIWPGMPLVGPETQEELNSRICEAEQEIDKDGGMLWDDFKAMLKGRSTPSYAV